ncbi:C-type mannose receptor 2-like isoform X2 [Notothenia coriiceps]|uniref:C-type mannose receptor 2-like isoform X2 n=1 Tax=Notothenia coriiceps TaxID=8208 RepID=A0A6I9NBR8_9TELE|nr:PREDICTED: C-type mannose receptor 2-like isoform X2 [Notothenia coriiceps]
MTWTEAQSYCREHHTDLASVRNLAENQQIDELLTGGGKHWIGLYRDSWKWSDGSNSSFKYWADYRPKHRALKVCVAAAFDNSGKWEDLDCGVEKPFICYGRDCACFNASDKGEGGETKLCGSERPRFSGCDVGGGEKEPKGPGIGRQRPTGLEEAAGWTSLQEGGEEEEGRALKLNCCVGFYQRKVYFFPQSPRVTEFSCNNDLNNLSVAR